MKLCFNSCARTIHVMKLQFMMRKHQFIKKFEQGTEKQAVPCFFIKFFYFSSIKYLKLQFACDIIFVYYFYD